MPHPQTDHMGPDRVREIIRGQFCAEDAPDNASLADDLGADSLDIMELAMTLEEVFDVELDDEKMLACKTVGDVVVHVMELVGKT